MTVNVSFAVFFSANNCLDSRFRYAWKWSPIVMLYALLQPFHLPVVVFRIRIFFKFYVEQPVQYSRKLFTWNVAISPPRNYNFRSILRIYPRGKLQT